MFSNAKNEKIKSKVHTKIHFKPGELVVITNKKAFRESCPQDHLASSKGLMLRSSSRGFEGKQQGT